MRPSSSSRGRRSVDRGDILIAHGIDPNDIVGSVTIQIHDLKNGNVSVQTRPSQEDLFNKLNRVGPEGLSSAEAYLLRAVREIRLASEAQNQIIFVPRKG